ncbi:MAG TPA: glutaredoxin domain-containing protein [Roseiflexaceae bacterium]|nr:glutaredoxin domain-containing protein [Roseiflexaceae bacterium]
MVHQTIKIYGTPWCGDCRRALRVLDQHNANYQYVDIESDDLARSYVERLNNGYQSVPTILFPDGSVLVEPSSATLAEKLTTLGSL